MPAVHIIRTNMTVSSPRRVSCRTFRCTKGASKARRDRINSEIRSMRDLLPISQEEQQRLSYLHSMSAVCTFIRKSVFYPELQTDSASSCLLPYQQLLHTLPGFIVSMTREGKLIYISENVVDYLGFSMVDALQGDTFYDLVQSADVEVVRSHLAANTTPNTECAFVCHMHTSKAFRQSGGAQCSMLVRGGFDSAPGCPLGQAFVALCTPTANRLQEGKACWPVEPFHTQHRPDMTLCLAADSVLYHLGYTAHELIGQSWYSLLHPEDVCASARWHRRLLEVEEGVSVEMVLRLQCRDLSWARLYVRATRDCDASVLSCTNFPISEVEFLFLQQQLCVSSSSSSGDSAPAPPQSPTLNPQTKTPSPEDKTLCVFYVLCVEQEGNQQVEPVSTPALPSTPPYSPIPYQQQSLPSSSSTCECPDCPAHSRIVPDCLPKPEMPSSPSNCSFHQDDPADPMLVLDLLTPDPSPCYSAQEQEEISILAQQISSLASTFDAYRGSAPSAIWAMPNAPLEEELDETLTDWWEQEARSSCGIVHHASLEPPGYHDDYRELHQLSHYPHISFQRDQLCEESMY